METVKNAKRVKVCLAAFLILAGLLTVRLVQIQVISHEEFEAAAAVQQYISVEGLDTRGMIFDRNMQPLTGRNYKYYYIIRKDRKDGVSSRLLEEIGGKKVSKEHRLYNVYEAASLKTEETRRLKEEYGAYVFGCRSRYSEVQPACHLIGYLSDWNKKGVSGMELFFEEILEAEGTGLVVTADAAGKIISGKQPVTVRTANRTPLDNSVITSIDISLQKKCEELLAGSSACIVTDCLTGEILAMASSPGFNPDRIEEHLTQDTDCLINKALQAAYPPGSVFKLVTAAAALEDLLCLPEKEFECKGKITAEGVTTSCSTAPEGGHGSLDMRQAMAKSCNCYFVQLGQLAGRERILDMAEKLGLGARVFEDFPEESKGVVPAPEETSAADIANISIGQGDLLVTPLQTAKLTQIIANKGIYREMTILRKESAAEDVFSFLAVKNGAYVKTQDQKEQRVISQKTARILAEMMRGVMTQGTGSAGTFPGSILVYGKSGTAEASRKGEKIKDCWFTGFFTDDQQRCFSVTVFVEDGTSGAADALPIFESIVNYFSSR